jgi:hypothetical protein
VMSHVQTFSREAALDCHTTGSRVHPRRSRRQGWPLSGSGSWRQCNSGAVHIAACEWESTGSSTTKAVTIPASIPASSLKAATTVPGPPSAPPPTPASVIGAPAPLLDVIAPSSSLPIPLSTTVGSGGSSGVSLPGGGGGSLQDCLAFWDRETHMSKAEWKASCQRSIHRLENLPSFDLLPARTPSR